MPNTARSLGLSRRQFYDPEKNLTAAARYLRIQYDRYHAVSDDAPVWLRTRLAIASYNAGAARVRAVVKVRGERSWSRISRELPVSTVRHVNTIVDKLYPRFVDLHSNSFRPRPATQTKSSQALCGPLCDEWRRSAPHSGPYR